jgi:hypothetical protein
MAMMEFLGRTEVMIGMGVLLVLLIVALPAMALIMVLRANRVPRRREMEEATDERPESEENASEKGIVGKGEK